MIASADMVRWSDAHDQVVLQAVDEWLARQEAAEAAQVNSTTSMSPTSAAQPAPIQNIEHCLWARNGKTPCPHTTAPIAAQPAPRQWVGLDAEDRLCATYMQDAPDGLQAVIDYIEAKLKEKNA